MSTLIPPGRLEERVNLPHERLAETFEIMQHCGAGRRECQVLWIGPWHSPDLITEVIHPRHHADGHGFSLDGGWLNTFWIDLASRHVGIRVQVHSHPQSAFHSPTDDEFPIIRTEGFLSLVIPRFALGPVSLEGAYLAEVQFDGSWSEVDAGKRVAII